MPRITILEKDISSPGITRDETVNNVYIPGYAYKGEIKTPVLCNTLAEFVRHFGKVPYSFQNDQDYPNGFAENATPGDVKFAAAGDYDKSFIMAYELLNQGLPVLYERIPAVDFKTMKNGYAFCESGILTVTSLIGGIIGQDIDIEVKPYDDANKATVTVYISSEKGLVDEDFVGVYDLDASSAGSMTVKDVVTLSWRKSGLGNTFLALNKGSLMYIGAEEFTVAGIYAYFTGENSSFTEDKLGDRGEYNIKYISTGGYPTFEYSSGNVDLSDKILKCAAARGDCVFLLDHTNNESRSIKPTDNTSVYSSLQKWKIDRGKTNDADNLSFGAMFTPYALYTGLSFGVNGTVEDILPASFGYLYALAVSIRSNPDWLAVAGTARGRLDQIVALRPFISNSLADRYQPRDDISLNAITTVNQRYTLWGNRTLKDNSIAGDLVATSFLNIRNLTGDVKKVVYDAAKALTFEQNSDVLWINFKAEITPLLDKMVSGNGLSDYEIRRQSTTKKATVKAVIRLYAIEAVEDWDITIELADSTVTTLE